MKKDILLAGVGGQGTVLASKLLAQCAVSRGLDVRTAETIGMAQRGGSVTSHVRIGSAYSPLIPKGKAEVLIAFEPSEAARSIAYLRQGGTLIVSRRGIMPSAGGSYDPAEVVRWLREYTKDIIEIDAESVFRESGTYRSLNIALLGAASRTIGFSREEIEAAMFAVMPENRARGNLSALNLGVTLAG